MPGFEYYKKWDNIVLSSDDESDTSPAPIAPTRLVPKKKPKKEKPKKKKPKPLSTAEKTRQIFNYDKWADLAKSDDEDEDGGNKPGVAPAPSRRPRQPKVPGKNRSMADEPPSSFLDGRAAIASTVKDVKDRIGSWVRWHLHIGFERLFLFFDDPEEKESMEIARKVGDKAVVIIKRDKELLKEWQDLPSWEGHKDVAEDEIQVRQVLNVQFCMRLCRKECISWLLNIDSDELFLPDMSLIDSHCAAKARGAVPHLFCALAGNECEVFSFANHEAVPEEVAPVDESREASDKSRGDPFMDLSLFKKSNSPAFVEKNPMTEQIVDGWRDRQHGRDFGGGQYFLYYEHGKSAVKCDTDGCYVPPTVHHFWPRNVDTGMWDKERLRKHGFTNDARNTALYNHCPQIRASILHYPLWDPNALWAKYKLHGDFSDEIAGIPTRQGSLRWGDLFHAQCRDTYLAAKDDSDGGRQAMHDLFKNIAALENKEEADRQVRSGLLCRVGVVQEVLRGGGKDVGGAPMWLHSPN